MLAAHLGNMPSLKNLSVGLVGVAALALVSLHADRASACSIACDSTPRVAGQKLVSPVIKMPTFAYAFNPSAPAPTLRRGDIDVPITSVNDGAFGLAIAAAEPLEPGEYTLVTSNGCSSQEVTSSFTVLPGEAIPTEASEISSTSKFESADPEASMDTCGTRYGETFDHVNVDFELRMPDAYAARFPLVRTTVSVDGPNASTKQQLTPQRTSLNLRRLVVSCAGPSDKPQPGIYRVKVESELLGVGKLAASEKEIQISCPQTGAKPNKDAKVGDTGDVPGNNAAPAGPVNGGTSSSGSCSSAAGPARGSAASLLLGALGIGLVVRRRRRA
jgi:MYXO-CTERM domain-containing protein